MYIGVFQEFFFLLHYVFITFICIVYAVNVYSFGNDREKYKIIYACVCFMCSYTILSAL